MIPTDPPPDFTLIKWAGGALGGVLSLIYSPPHNWRDFLARLVFSTISGGVLGFMVMDYFGWQPTVERWFGASVIVGGFAWVTAGVVVALLKRMDKLPK